MQKYLCLMQMTDQGIKDVKNAPARVQHSINRVKELGGQITSIYTLLGEYDYAAVMEFPSDELAKAFLLELGSKGNVRTTTMRAFAQEEFADVVSKLK